MALDVTAGMRLPVPPVVAVLPEHPSDSRPSDLLSEDDRPRFSLAVARTLVHGSASLTGRLVDGVPVAMDVFHLPMGEGLLLVVIGPAAPGGEPDEPLSLTSSRAASARCDAELRFTEASSDLQRLFALDPQDLLAGWSLLDILHPDHHDEILRRWSTMVSEPGQVLHDRVRIARGDDGRWAWVDLVAVRYEIDVEGSAACAVVLIDVDESVESAKTLQQRAERDPVTGLFNRWFALDRLAADPGGVLYLDLDGFKTINDRHGHAAGDAALARVAERLLSMCRGSDLVARVGGDEFLVVCPGIEDVSRLEVLAERVVGSFREPFRMGFGTVRVGCSVGVSVARGDDAERAVADADLAMYRAKQAGGRRHVVFDAALRAAADRHRELVRLLPTALADGELLLHHQPIVDIGRRRLAGTEALLRWRRPTGELISPAEILPAAVDAGVLGAIGLWALSELSDAVPRLRAVTGDPRSAVGVNFSAGQLAEPGFLETLDDVLAGGIDPSNVVVELTETERLDQVPEASAVLSELPARGVRVALDDFGIGWSVLDHLVSIDARVVKIDRSLILRIGEPAVRATLVALVGLCRDLDKFIVAEGIETEAQLRQVMDVGVTEIQGWLFGRPAELEEAVTTAWGVMEELGFGYRVGRTGHLHAEFSRIVPNATKQ